MAPSKKARVGAPERTENPDHKSFREGPDEQEWSVYGGGGAVHTQHSSLPKSNKRGTTLEPHLSDHDPDSTSN